MTEDLDDEMHALPVVPPLAAEDGVGRRQRLGLALGEELGVLGVVGQLGEVGAVDQPEPTRDALQV